MAWDLLGGYRRVLDSSASWGLCAGQWMLDARRSRHGRLVVPDARPWPSHGRPGTAPVAAVRRPGGAAPGIGRIGREELVPAFHAQEYGVGVSKALEDIGLILSNTSRYDATLLESDNSNSSSWKLWYVVLIVVVVILVIVGLGWYASGNRKYGDDYIGAGILAALFGSNRGKGGSGGGGFGGSGGFGGGSFGGGGSGGKW